MRFQIENMHCGGCARSVTQAILSVDPAARVEADMSSRSLTVASDRPGKDFLPALEAAGYPAVEQP
jgi:copper chaperone